MPSQFISLFLENPMLIAIDFDNTLYYSRRLNEKAIDVLLKLQKNHQLMLWTCRENESLKEAITILKKRGVVIYLPPSSPRKAIYDLLIDDRNLGTPCFWTCRGEKVVDWDEVEKILKKEGLI